MVADLPHGIVYLFYFYQYDKPVVLSVKDELANARADGPLSKLFPDDVQQEAARRYQHIHKQREYYQKLGKLWLSLVIFSLAILLISSIKRQKGLIFWIPVLAILGPVGLLIWLAAGRSRRIGNWQTILIETTGDLLPTVVAFLAVTVWLVLRMGASDFLLLFLYFNSPLIIGVLIFHGPLLAFATRNGYGRTFLRRLPHTWATGNLGVAVIFALALPIVNISIQLPLQPWTVVFWWGLIVMCALAAMLLLLLYEVWNVHRGYKAWSALAWREGEVVSASWRKLWWWILLSYAALLGGIAGYLFVQQVVSG